MNIKKSVSPVQNEQGYIDLGEYLKPLWICKWRILLFSVIVASLVALLVSKITPIYSASATLLIETTEKQTLSIDEVYGLETDKKEYLTTQYEILRSNKLAEEVIAKLDLSTQAEFLPEKPSGGFIYQIISLVKSVFGLSSEESSITASKAAYLNQQKVLDTFKSKLSIFPIRDTQLVAIAFESSDPELAAKVVNALGYTYINSHMEAKMAMTNNAMSWLQERSKTIDADLQLASKRLQAYKNSEQIVDLEDGMQSMNSSTIKNINERYLNTKNKRLELETTLEQVLGQNNGVDNALQGSAVLAKSIVLQDIRKAMLEAESTYTELDQTYGPKHPKMVAAKAEVVQLKEKLAKQFGKEVEDLQSQLKALRESEKQLFIQLQQAEGEFLSASEKETQYIRLKGDVERLTELRNLIVTRFKEMDITSDFTAASARFTDEATPPIYPVRPKKALMVIMALIISTFLACGFVLVNRALTNTFKSPSDIESELNVRFLGLIPLIKVKRGERLPVYTYFDSSQRLFTEAIRTLRTGFLLHHIERDKTITLITSAVPDEGKTTTALNLAFSLGQMEKVLVVDADLRKPSIGKQLGIPGYNCGLANLLSETASIEDCIVPDEVAGIDILPAGQVSTNALEQLSSPQFGIILSELKNKYDRIIVDSAPCQAVSDALVISKVVDNTLLVVSAGDTGKEVVKSAVSRLLESGAHIEGAILTSVDITKRTSEYFGYFDYYEYGNTVK